MMNCDSPVEVDRRCSRITRSSMKEINDSLSNDKPTPTRKRSRPLYYTGKRRKRKPISAVGCINSSTVEPILDLTGDDSRTSEVPTITVEKTAEDGVNNDYQNMLHDNREFTVKEENISLVNQKPARRESKRVYSDVECEQSPYKKKLRPRLGQQEKQSSPKRKQSNKTSSKLNQEAEQNSESLIPIVKQEVLSPVSSSSVLPDQPSPPSTPSNTHTCSSSSQLFYICKTPSMPSQPTAEPINEPIEDQSDEIVKKELNQSFNEQKFQPQDSSEPCPPPMSTFDIKPENDIKSENVSINWLDVSKILIRPELIVRAIRSDGATRNNQETKMIFNLIYEKFGKHRDEFAVVSGTNCIRILTDCQQSRLKIKQELVEIFESNNQLDVKLFVGMPDLKKPLIEFETKRRASNHFWVYNLKRWNQWPQESSVICKSTKYIKGDKYKITIEVDSEIRQLIEHTDGMIVVDEQRVNVVDALGLNFCYNCLSYNKCWKSTCDNRNRCCYCAGYHENECWYKSQPNRWFCSRCKVRGHSVISKDCPVLPSKLRSRLSKIDHKYKHIFLMKYDDKNGNSKNAMARLY